MDRAPRRDGGGLVRIRNPCSPGRAVEVYGISDPESVVKVGEYDGELEPAVHMKAYRNYGLVRTYNGFKVYRVAPLP